MSDNVPAVVVLPEINGPPRDQGRSARVQENDWSAP
jgi:hypothetical protein